MVKKTSSGVVREGAQVPKCQSCGTRVWTDWRPQFQKYLCTSCCEKGPSHGAFLDRREKRSN